MSEQRRLGHDIRNSMNALRLHTECLRICEGDELVESLDAISEACDRMVEFMDAVDALPNELPSDGNA